MKELTSALRNLITLVELHEDNRAVTDLYLAIKVAEQALADYENSDTVDRPKVVCLCGSTRFADLHAIKRWELERDGSHIVLMINYLPGWYADEEFGREDHIGEAAGCKEALDTKSRKIPVSSIILSRPL